MFRRVALLLAVALIVPLGIAAKCIPRLPASWPFTTLQLGMADGPGGAAALKQTAPFGFRYQYLSAGVNTGYGWATWNANGDFAKFYIQDSVANGIVPVFTYYNMRQSLPGANESEAQGDYDNMQNTQTMTAYYNDLKLFFQKAGAFPSSKVVLHVEPDLWGYLEQRASGDDASTVLGEGGGDGPARPRRAAGQRRPASRRRSRGCATRYAPNVILGYHLSIWGTGQDLTYSDPSDATVDALATKAAQLLHVAAHGVRRLVRRVQRPRRGVQAVRSTATAARRGSTRPTSRATCASWGTSRPPRRPASCSGRSRWATRRCAR